MLRIQVKLICFLTRTIAKHKYADYFYSNAYTCVTFFLKKNDSKTEAEPPGQDLPSRKRKEVGRYREQNR